MDCTLKEAGGRQYVDVRAYEAFTSESVATFQKEAGELAGVHGVAAFLFDVRGFGNLIGTLQTIEAVERCKRVFPAFSRIAVLTADDDPSYGFLETVAQNRGLALKCFTREGEVLTWRDSVPPDLPSF